MNYSPLRGCFCVSHLRIFQASSQMDQIKLYVHRMEKGNFENTNIDGKSIFTLFFTLLYITFLVPVKITKGP